MLPIVANRRIEHVADPQFDAAALPFQPLVCSLSKDDTHGMGSSFTIVDVDLDVCVRPPKQPPTILGGHFAWELALAYAGDSPANSCLALIISIPTAALDSNGRIYCLVQSLQDFVKLASQPHLQQDFVRSIFTALHGPEPSSVKVCSHLACQPQPIPAYREGLSWRSCPALHMPLEFAEIFTRREFFG